MTSLSHGRARHAQSSGLVVTLAIFGIGNGDAQSVLPGHFLTLYYLVEELRSSFVGLTHRNSLLLFSVHRRVSREMVSKRS